MVNARLKDQVISNYIQILLYDRDTPALALRRKRMLFYIEQERGLEE
jgi:hypothetical protein